MGCKLSPSTDPQADYEGSVTPKGGVPAQIGVHGMAGNAFIQPGTSYAGQLLQDPWKFPIQAGIQRLLVFVGNPVPDDPTVIEEICDDGSRSTLLAYNYNPGANQISFTIKGIP